MRRSDRERDRSFALQVIDDCEYGTVAFSGESPYCVPLSLARAGDTLYFHCAFEGKKLEYLRKNPAVFVSFVSSNVAATDEFTTFFKSAMVAGQAYEVTKTDEKIQALRLLCEKLTPEHMEQFDRAIERSLVRTGVWAITMEEITGKEKARRPGV